MLVFEYFVYLIWQKTPKKLLLDFLNLRSFLNVLPMDPSHLCLNMSRVNFCQTIEQLFRGDFLVMCWFMLKNTFGKTSFERDVKRKVFL